ncbi:hypothetical protein ACOJVU_04675 [Mycobacterium sp. THU-M104]|uniref:hypothetical protein n=1 Tax=Mycobacterium sp. THU-M104 TaxID=3410515 RepID=UPI003B9D68C8
MSDGEQSESPAREEPDDSAPPEIGPTGDRIFSLYGVASAVLGVLAVVAVVLGGLVWSGHRDAVAERTYLTRVMQTAADWAGVLINMNSGNIDTSLQRLHDGTVGELSAEFDAAVHPYRQVVEKLQSRSSGRIEAVAIDTLHRNLDTQPGGATPPRSLVTTKLPPFASRTDSVLLVATSVSENAGAKPQTVHWNLRLDVSEVDGKLMISKLESIR